MPGEKYAAPDARRHPILAAQVWPRWV